MERQQALCQAVAEFLKVDPHTVGADFPLTGRRLQGSIGRAALDAAIRRKLGLTSPAVYSARTYGELEQALVGATPATNGHAPASPPSAPTAVTAPAEKPAAEGAAAVVPGMACGIDIEQIDNLPPAADYWEEDFYKNTFTPDEIAYCTTQPDPRPHFAARWCAKEALKKCDPAFLAAEMNTLELTRRESGAVALRQLAGGAARELPFAVSVSHTATAAVAVVVRPPEAAPAARVEPPAPPPAPAAPRGGPALARLAVLLSFLAACLAAWAVLRTF